MVGDHDFCNGPLRPCLKSWVFLLIVVPVNNICRFHQILFPDNWDVLLPIISILLVTIPNEMSFTPESARRTLNLATWSSMDVLPCRIQMISSSASPSLSYSLKLFRSSQRKSVHFPKLGSPPAVMDCLRNAALHELASPSSR